jgi:hypothetical protein
VGVGNVELRTGGGASFAALTTPGIVGRRARAARVSEQILPPNTLVAMFTDGVASSRLDLAPFALLAPEDIASGVVASHGKTNDDVLCAVLRVPARGALP